jgi:hypothetical protein
MDTRRGPKKIEFVRLHALDRALPKAKEIIHAARKNSHQVSGGTEAQPFRQADPTRGLEVLQQ